MLCLLVCEIVSSMFPGKDSRVAPLSEVGISPSIREIIHYGKKERRGTREMEERNGVIVSGAPGRYSDEQACAVADRLG